VVPAAESEEQHERAREGDRRDDDVPPFPGHLKSLDRMGSSAL
jgi:hypothetical protein